MSSGKAVGNLAVVLLRVSAEEDEVRVGVSVNGEIAMCDSNSLHALQVENSQLKQRMRGLQKELDLLKLHPALAAGLKGETLICRLVDGKLTKYADSCDIIAGQVKIEVKYSALGVPVIGSPTRRWSWSKPLGWKDKGKNYDLLLLLGEKDDRFPLQYLDDTGYVCFAIPLSDVQALMFKGASIGGIIQITTNFAHVSNVQSKSLLKYMVPLSEVLDLVDSLQIQQP